MNYVKLLIGILTVIFVTTGYGQTALVPTWTKIDSSSNKTSEGWGLDVDADGNIYWAISNDDLGNGLDIYCYKFSQDGTPIWSTPLLFGGAGTQHAYVCNVVDSGLFIGGRVCPDLVTSCDMLLIKADKNTGSLVWNRSKNFTANGYDEVDGLEVTKEGIFCGGWSQELNSSIYQSDIGLWKVDFDGKTQWTNFLGEESTAEHQDGHFVVDDEYIYAAGLWGGKGIANLYNGHSFLGKFDKVNGEIVDTTLFGHQGPNFNDIENALGMATDGKYLYITGYTMLTNTVDWQIFVAKYDKNLNQIWYTNWGGSGNETARAIQVRDSIIYIGGLTESSSLMTGGGVSDAILLKLDTSGTLLSYHSYGGSAEESIQDLVVRGDRIYLTGTIKNDKSEKRSLLLSIDSELSGIEETYIPIQPLYNLYPNPSEGAVTIEFSNCIDKPRQIRIFNETGKLLQSKMLSNSSKKTSLNIEHRGVLFFEIQFDRYRSIRRIVNKRTASMGH